MPYIKQDQRPVIDMHVAHIAEHVKFMPATDAAGALNYTCTTLALKLFPQRKYWVLALVIGVIVTVVLEFYRRRAAPYEDDKIAENGDVF